MADSSPRRRRTQLDTLQDVKAELARTVRKLRALKLDTDAQRSVALTRITQHKAVVYALSTLADVIERADIEARLDKLEQRTGVGEAPAVQ